MREATVTAYGGLKLRQMPDMSSGTLATMPYGSAVTVTGGAVNGFYAVSYEELSGYASAQYLSFERGTSRRRLFSRPRCQKPVTPSWGASAR